MASMIRMIRDVPKMPPKTSQYRSADRIDSGWPTTRQEGRDKRRFTMSLLQRARIAQRLPPNVTANPRTSNESIFGLSGFHPPPPPHFPARPSAAYRPP